MIELFRVTKSFGDQMVLNHLDLVIPTGKITAVIGPSGEGKSVLLRHIIGLLKPDMGRVVVDGEDITHMNRAELNRVRERFGFLFQNAALFDSMTVFENVAFPLQEKTRLTKAEIRDRVHEALEDVGLRDVDDKYPDELSGGMKKRVGLARALICNAMHRLISETHKRHGFTAVIVTHEVPAIFEICEYVAMLYKGRIQMRGTPDEIRNSEDPVVRQFITGELEGPLKFV